MVLAEDGAVDVRDQPVEGLPEPVDLFLGSRRAGRCGGLCAYV